MGSGIQSHIRSIHSPIVPQYSQSFWRVFLPQAKTRVLLVRILQVKFNLRLILIWTWLILNFLSLQALEDKENEQST